MSNQQNPSEHLSGVNPEHIGLLNASLRSPSAHNAQPWQIRPLDDSRSYELHYDQNSDLPEDPDKKDAYLTMGAFVETMVLQAPSHGLDVTVTPELTRDGQNLYIARVAISSFEEGGLVDPLSEWVGKRVTNRNHYKKDPLPAELKDELQKLGNSLVNPKLLENAVLEASMNSWANPRYIHDLKAWLRKDKDAEDGFTALQMHLSKLDVIGINFADWRGGFKSKLMERLYSSSEVAAFTSAPTCAVLEASDTTPTALFGAGRRLLRSWVTITAAGYSYQPYSIAVDDRNTAPKVAEIADVAFPAALYRIGKTEKSPRALSNRKPLGKVLIKNHTDNG